MTTKPVRPTEEQRDAAETILEGGGEFYYSPSRLGWLASILAARDAEIVRPWREAVAEVTPRYEAFMMQIPTTGDIQVLQKLVALLAPASKDAEKLK